MTSTRAARTRTRILEATRGLLEERGYHGVGLEAVAAAAGVSRQSIYVHFGSKAQLLLALVAHVDEQAGLSQLGDAVERAPSALAALHRFVDLVAALTPRVYRTAAALEAARLEAHEAEAAWADRMSSRRRRCARIVTRLGDEGLLAPEWSRADAADLLWAMTSFRVWEDLVVRRGWPTARFHRHLRLLLEHALVSDSTAARPANATAAGTTEAATRTPKRTS